MRGPGVVGRLAVARAVGHRGGMRVPAARAGDAAAAGTDARRAAGLRWARKPGRRGSSCRTARAAAALPQAGVEPECGRGACGPPARSARSRQGCVGVAAGFRQAAAASLVATFPFRGKCQENRGSGAPAETLVGAWQARREPSPTLLRPPSALAPPAAPAGCHSSRGPHGQTGGAVPEADAEDDPPIDAALRGHWASHGHTPPPGAPTPAETTQPLLTLPPPLPRTGRHHRAWP